MGGYYVDIINDVAANAFAVRRPRQQRWRNFCRRLQQRLNPPPPPSRAVQITSHHRQRTLVSAICACANVRQPLPPMPYPMGFRPPSPHDPFFFAFTYAIVSTLNHIQPTPHLHPSPYQPLGKVRMVPRRRFLCFSGFPPLRLSCHLDGPCHTRCLPTLYQTYLDEAMSCPTMYPSHWKYSIC